MIQGMVKRAEGKSGSSGFMRPTLIMLVVVLILWGGCILMVRDSSASAQDAQAVFAALGALFAGLGIAGVVGALHQQSAQLGMHGEELDVIRADQDIQRKLILDQAAALARSRESEQFFQLFRHYRSELDSVDPGDPTKAKGGHRAVQGRLMKLNSDPVFPASFHALLPLHYALLALVRHAQECEGRVLELCVRLLTDQDREFMRRMADSIGTDGDGGHYLRFLDLPQG